MHVRGEKCGVLPPLRWMQPRPRVRAAQRCKDARMEPSASLRPPSSCLVLAAPRNLKRLNDSASTFGRRAEYVGLCSLSEPLDSCRESPAAPGDPKDTRPFKSEEGDGITQKGLYHHILGQEGLHLHLILEKKTTKNSKIPLIMIQNLIFSWEIQRFHDFIHTNSYGD